MARSPIQCCEYDTNAWLLGRGPTLLLAGLIALTLGIFYYGADRAWFPPIQYHGPCAQWLFLNIMIGLTVAVALLSHGGYLRQVREARRAAQELERHKHELETSSPCCGIALAKKVCYTTTIAAAEAICIAIREGISDDVRCLQELHARLPVW